MNKREEERIRKREEKEQILHGYLMRIEQLLWEDANTSFWQVPRTLHAGEIAEMMTEEFGEYFSQRKVQRLIQKYGLVVLLSEPRETKKKTKYTEKDRYNMQLDSYLKELMD